VAKHGAETTEVAVSTRVRSGVRIGRTYLAKTIMTVALVVALLLGLGAVLVGFGANPDNVLVGGLTRAGGWLAGPFGDLFTFADHTRQVLVDWVIAAVAYLVVGGVLARLIRP
jgi:phosphate/sulfate permease